MKHFNEILCFALSVTLQVRTQDDGPSFRSISPPTPDFFKISILGLTPKKCLKQSGSKLKSGPCESASMFSVNPDNNDHLCLVTKSFAKTTKCLTTKSKIVTRFAAENDKVPNVEFNNGRFKSDSTNFCYGYSAKTQGFLGHNCQQQDVNELDGTKWKYKNKCFTVKTDNQGDVNVDVKVNGCRNKKKNDRLKTTQDWKYEDEQFKTIDGLRCITVAENNRLTTRPCLQTVLPNKFARGSFGVYLKQNQIRWCIKVGSKGNMRVAPCSASLELIDITQPTAKPTEVKTTIPSGWFKCYHRKNVAFTQEGRVLRPKIENGWDDEDFSGFLIDEKVKWYSIKLEKFGWYANVGLGTPKPELYNKRYSPLGRSIKGTISLYQTKEYSYVYNAYMYKFLNIGQTESSYRKSSVKWTDGDLIKVEQRVSSTVWFRNGNSFISHYWETGDERDLRPAFDIFYTEENYIVTLGDTVE